MIEWIKIVLGWIAVAALVFYFWNYGHLRGLDDDEPERPGYRGSR